MTKQLSRLNASTKAVVFGILAIWILQNPSHTLTNAFTPLMSTRITAAPTSTNTLRSDTPQTEKEYHDILGPVATENSKKGEAARDDHFRALSSRREWAITSTSSAATAAFLSLRPQSAHAEMVAIPAILDETSTPLDILCDPSVSIFKHPTKDRIVYLLGTAHISSKSADAAAQLVRDMKPKAVFVELDAKRVGRAIPKPTSDTWPMPPGDQAAPSPAAPSETDSDSASSPSIKITFSSSNDDGSGVAAGVSSETAPPGTKLQSAIQPDQPNLSKPKFFDFRERALRKGSELLGNSIKGLYSKLESEGFSAGEEFVVAVKEGLKINSKIILGDRDVEVTLRRLTEALAKTDLKKLLAADSELEENMKQLLPKDLNPADIQGGEMNAEQLKYFVETVKAKDNVRLLMNNLKSVAPEVYEAMVAERDVFMANGLDGLNQFQSIVAVMGIAHVDGVENTLKSRGWVEIKPSCNAV